jgi:fucose permease
LQLGLALVALGGMVGLVFFDVLYRTAGYKRTMAILALIFLLPAILSALQWGIPLRPEPPVSMPIGELLREPGLWMAALVLFFYAPLEGFVSVWATTYLKNAGEGERQTTNWLGGFWAMVLLSRALAGIIMHSTELVSYSPWVLVFFAVLVAAILGNMSAMIRGQSALALLLMLGFFVGPVYPSLVGMVLAMPGGSNWPATAFASLHVAGSLGGLVLAPLVSYCARANISVGLRIPMFLALVMAVVALLFAILATSGAR